MTMNNYTSSMQGIDPDANIVSCGPFEAVLEIVRPANTTAYAAQDMINTGANVTLPYFDLSAFGVNRKVIINYMSIMSDYAAKAAALQADARLYGVNNPQADCSDNTACNPTYAAMKNRLASLCYTDADQPSIGSGAYIVGRWRNEQLITSTDALGRLYLALIALNAYTPASGEKMYVRITGFVQ